MRSREAFPHSILRRLNSALVATGFLLVAIYFGSGGFAHFDPALLGYCAATMVASFAIAYQIAALWQRPSAAFYGRVLLGALRRPRRLLAVIRIGARELAAQSFITPRGRLRWLAHMALAWGTLLGFAVTLPLVFGWLHFEAAGSRYHPVLLSLRVPAFAIDGALGWGVFHALHIAAALVIGGVSYFLALRLRLRRHPEVATRFHLAPLLLLLSVALTGLALSTAAPAGGVWFRVAALSHEATVIALLVALPYSKLIHVFIRPLHLGARLLRAHADATVTCVRCGDAIAPAAQHAMVATLLAERGLHFPAQQQLCPACRRRQLAVVQAQLFGAHFHPRPAAPRPRLRKAA